MKVAVLTYGTRGSVQPYAALAQTLERAGHHATLAAPAAMASFVEDYDFHFFALDDGPNNLLNDPAMREAMEKNFRGIRGRTVATRIVHRYMSLMAGVLNQMTASVDNNTDVVVHQPGLPAHMLAEKFGIASIPAAMQPGWVPTKEFPSPMLSREPPSLFNRISYLQSIAMYRTFSGIARGWRKHTLRLPPRFSRYAPAAFLQAFSPYMLPRIPKDYSNTVHTTGFWFLPNHYRWTPPTELAEFLRRGDPPIYIGFGSMAGKAPGRTGELVANAIKKTGVRAVVVKGWGGLDLEATNDVFVVDQVPHSWLFPRMAAIVHHGGAGTTGTALASGRPQVVCPFVGDQPFYARRMYSLGVSTKPLPQTDLTVETLSDAICSAVTSKHMAERADEMGERIGEEQGVQSAVEILESLT